MAKIYIGVAWPYASGSLHLGHVAGALLPADIFSRYHRMKGNDVIMVSGSDMHGTPITVAAEKENVPPEEFAMRNHKMNVQSLIDLDIDFDLYTHTDTQNHHEVVQDMFLTCRKNGHVELRTMKSTYCEKCSRFLPDRYVEGECPECGYDEARGDQCDECGHTLDPEELLSPRCKICGNGAVFKDTDHFFFQWSDFNEDLLEWISDKDHWKVHVHRFTKKYLEEGLKDSAITRDLDWGIEIPLEGYEGKTIYVWFEAVIGYLSATKEYFKSKGDPDGWKGYWHDSDSKHYYFLAKDNIPFHTIRWPAMLLAYEGLELPYDVPANQYLRWEDEQFSRSRGIGMDVPSFLKKYDKESLRYYLTITMPENRDTDFSLEEYAAQVNNTLLATFGNFIHRALIFTFKNFGEVPPKGTYGEDEKEILAKMNIAREKWDNHLSACRFKNALNVVMDFARECNKYFNDQEPWRLVKEDKERCATVLHTSLLLSRGLAVLMNPFIPSAAQRVWDSLGEEGEVQTIGYLRLDETMEASRKLEKPSPLFKKIELEEAEENPLEELDIRVGKILSIEDHPNADKLYILQVDLGEKKIQLVAGLKPYYTPDEMMCGNILVLANLKKARLRGATSEGMLLAGDDGEGTVSLIRPPEGATPGTQVDFTKKGASTIKFEQFQKFHFFTGKPLEGGKADVGRTVRLEGEANETEAFLITSKKAYPMNVGEKPVESDRELPPGSKIR